MWVIVIRAELVQVQQGLVHALLKLQGTFEGLNTAAPLVPLWLLQHKAGQETSVRHVLNEDYDPRQKAF